MANNRHRKKKHQVAQHQQQPEVTVEREQDNRAKRLTMRKRIGEGLLILVVAIALFFLLVLVSYHSTDASWSNTGDGLIANAGGWFGAQTASILLSFFGYPAYITPILLIVFARELYCRNWRLNHSRWHFVHTMTSSLGFLLVIIGVCGISNALLPINTNLVPMSAGGIIGDSAYDTLLSTFNNIGSLLILFVLFFIGLTLFLGVSWVALSRATIKGVLYLFAYCGKGIQRKYQQSRQEKAEQEQALAVNPRVSKQQPSLRVLKASVPNTENAMAASPEKVKNTPPIPTVVLPPVPTAPSSKPSASRNKPLATDVLTALPSLDLLDNPPERKKSYATSEKLAEMSASLERHLAHFNIEAQVVGVEPGPVVTRFEVELSPGMKVNRVSNIDKDLARSMAVASVRVVEVIPGRPYIGIEIPNVNRDLVCLKELLTSKQYQQSLSPLTLALGKDISGNPVIMDLQKMPHLLVAGTTGSGKSVSLNAMILGMLFKATPKQLRFIMVDPKMLELSVYKDIPHLLTPVITDMREANNALRWCIAEMERRYRLMAQLGVRNLESLNQKLQTAIDAGEPCKDPLFISTGAEGEEAPLLDETIPYIVILIDELADMMMVVGKKVEQSIARIAQKARAAGIHMILATQRPSVDVLTGLIKANIPSRIAFSVSSRIDSRTIIDQQGAHQLLGYGDMLFLAPGTSLPMRAHGPFVSDNELHHVTEALRSSGNAQYVEAILEEDGTADGASNNSDISGTGNGETDPLYDQAVAIVIETRRASISLVQRRLRIGYNRAANLLETMEAAGVVSAMQGNGSREVLVPAGDA